MYKTPAWAWLDSTAHECFNLIYPLGTEPFYVCALKGLSKINGDGYYCPAKLMFKTTVLCCSWNHIWAVSILCKPSRKGMMYHTISSSLLLMRSLLAICSLWSLFQAITNAPMLLFFSVVRMRCKLCDTHKQCCTVCRWFQDSSGVGCM